MILKYKEITEKLDSKYFAHSCIDSKDIFVDIISNIKPIPKIIVEIGTYFGISTIILASICDIHTFDIKYYPETKYVWNKFTTKGNITYYIVNDSNETKRILKDISFDFAFVDSVHDYKNAKKDFETVKKCKRVLFHDNNDRFPGVAQFCKEINCKKIGDFGYWEVKCL